MFETVLEEILVDLKVWFPERSAIGSNNISLLRNMWADSGDALSLYYTGTRMRDQRLRKTHFDYWTYIIHSSYVDLSRLYLSRFALNRIEDIRRFMMGTNMLPKNPRKKFTSSAIPIKPTTHDYIYLRKSLIRSEQLHFFPYALFFFIRRMTAPSKISSFSEFIIAMIWLIIYIILNRLFGVSMRNFSRKPKHLVWLILIYRLTLINFLMLKLN
jgi:hypothetical protein